jgi:hypothetical protein
MVKKKIGNARIGVERVVGGSRQAGITLRKSEDSGDKPGETRKEDCALFWGA